MKQQIQSERERTCDVCGRNTEPPKFDKRFGDLWAYRTDALGARYRVDLCEICFVGALGLGGERKMIGDRSKRGLSFTG